MKHHLDHGVRFSEEIQNKSRYKWSLQEITSEGAAKGRHQIPWPWNLWFNATEIEYRKIVEVNKDGGAEAGAQNEMIRATLRAAPKSHFSVRPVRYSMLGTDRYVEEFSLRVFRLEHEEAPENCRVMGGVSYTSDFDFQNQTQDDYIEIEVSLHAKNFDELCSLAKTGGSNDKLTLSLKGVPGFYSEWSSSVTTDDIKILTGHDDEQILVGVNAGTIQPPRLGTVREFSLMYDRRTGTAVPIEARGSKPEFATPVPSEPDANDAVPDSTLLALVQVQQGIGQLRMALWVIVILIVASVLWAHKG